ncbi:MAG: hypothetical protein AB9842_07485 [Bacteroidales bacterium]
MKSCLTAIIVLIHWIFFTGLSHAQPSQAISHQTILFGTDGLSGKVYDSISKDAIIGATVTQYFIPTTPYAATKTDSTGMYGFYPHLFDIFSVTAKNYYPVSITLSENNNCQFFNIAMLPDSNHFIQLTDSLTIYADDIDTIDPDHYALSGDVNINKLLYFTSNVYVDQRPPYHVLPNISGNCNFIGNNIRGENIPITNDSHYFNFKAEDEKLLIRDWGSLKTVEWGLCGFNFFIPSFKLARNGDSLEIQALIDFPFPFNVFLSKGADYFEAGNLNALQELSFSALVSKMTGINYSGSVQDLEIEFPFVKLSEIELSFNTLENSIGGGLMMELPDRFKKGFSSNIPGKKPLLDKLGFNVELKDAALEELQLKVGSNIPLLGSGIMLKEVKGGITEFTDPENWMISLHCGLELGPDLLGFGPPVTFEDVGFSFHPWTYIEGEGNMKIFDKEVFGTKLAYDNDLMAFGFEANVQFGGILDGTLKMTASLDLLSGEGNMLLSLPSDPDNLFMNTFFKDYIGQTLGTANVKLQNSTFFGQGMVGDYALGFKVDYTGYPGLFSIDLFSGNELSMNQSGGGGIKWMGYKQGKSSVSFDLRENTRQLLLAASDTIDNFPVDFYLTDPSGDTVTNTTNGIKYYHSSDQAIMIIEYPEKGQWNFIALDSLDVKMVAFVSDPQPSVLLKLNPGNGLNPNGIRISLADYNDTMDVRVYYDTDSLHFNGKLIQEFQVINNATVDLSWQTDSIGEGKYYVYCIVDDGDNLPLWQYASGSVMIERNNMIPIPQNVSISYTSDTLIVQWEEPIPTNFPITLLDVLDVSTGITVEKTIVDTNRALLNSLQQGKTYAISCRFADSAWNSGDPSETFYYTLVNDSVNSSPYFAFEQQPMIFYEGLSGEIPLSAYDADGDNLVFNIAGDSLGIIIIDSTLNWAPQTGDEGIYSMMLTVSDGVSSDSMCIEIIVLPQEYLEISVSFSTQVLHAGDNTFIKIVKPLANIAEVPYSLKNLRTDDSLQLIAKKVSTKEYMDVFNQESNLYAELGLEHGDTLALHYWDSSNLFTAFAVFDSIAQYADTVKPSPVLDLQAIVIPGDKAWIKWTSGGDDGLNGKAFKYDLRYSSSPITTFSDYLVANLITGLPIPGEPGTTDSVLINLNELNAYQATANVYLCMRAEDEMMNYSDLSNNIKISKPLDINIICQLEDETTYDGIVINLSGTDSVNSTNYTDTTGAAGQVIFHSAPCGQYSITLEKSDYVTILDTLLITPDSQSFTYLLFKSNKIREIHGSVNYDNLDQSPLSNVRLFLRSTENIIVDSTLTSDEGIFVMYAPMGDYHITASCDKTPGGYNAIDGLRIIRHFTVLQLLTGLGLEAGDVNNNGALNAVDGLQVIQRFAGYMTGFNSGDWFFEQPLFVVPAEGVPWIQIKGICYGDVNGSFIIE